MEGHSYRKDNKQSSRTTGTMNKPQTRSKSGIPNMGDRSFHTSENIMQLQRTVGNKAVLQMMKSHSLEQQAPIQRRIAYMNKDELMYFPSTWRRLEKIKGSMPNDIQKLTDELIDKIKSSISSEYNDQRFMKVWGRVAKNEKKEFRLETQSNEIEEAFMNSYKRSTGSKEKYENRSKETKKIYNKLLPCNNSLIYKESARNSMVTSNNLEKFEYDKDTPKQSQIQTQISTVILHELNGEGEEIQSSLSKDKGNLLISSNLNRVNEILSQKLQDRGSLKSIARKILIDRGIKDMSREQAMKDRLVRHALKMFERISDYLSETGEVSVPPKLTVIEFDGRHAEIRIEQSGQWSQEKYYLPTGTKYPCMGCKLYFGGNGYDTGVTMGPLWLTNSAISTQMEPQLKEGMKLGDLGDQTDEVAMKIVNQYKALSDNVKMGWGKTKEGGYTLEHQAESESELDDDEFEKIKTDIMKRKREDDDKTGQPVTKKRKIKKKSKKKQIM
jgi:hypothetical protein